MIVALRTLQLLCCSLGWLWSMFSTWWTWCLSVFNPLQRQHAQRIFIILLLSAIWKQPFSLRLSYISLLSRLSASVMQSQSRAARKAGHNRSRHRATPAKVSACSLQSLIEKFTESVAFIVVFPTEWYCKDLTNTVNRLMEWWHILLVLRRYPAWILTGALTLLT